MQFEFSADRLQRLKIVSKPYSLHILNASTPSYPHLILRGVIILRIGPRGG